jgi:hypothetical protein
VGLTIGRNYAPTFRNREGGTYRVLFRLWIGGYVDRKIHSSTLTFPNLLLSTPNWIFVKIRDVSADFFELFPGNLRQITLKTQKFLNFTPPNNL